MGAKLHELSSYNDPQRQPALPLLRSIAGPAAHGLESDFSPFLKWVGGKSWLCRHYPELVLELQKGANYHEPFLGSGAVFLRMGHEHARLSDSNPDLINVFRAVRDRPEELIECLRQLQNAHDADQSGTYYQSRDAYNDEESRQKTRGNGFSTDHGVADPGPSNIQRAAWLIYLNRTGFNGLYRVNKRGLYNVPVGRYAKPDVVQESRIRRASRRLSAARIEVRGFEGLLDRVAAGDTVYLDPPYVPVSDSANFTSYGRDGFGILEQQRLAEVARILMDRGARVVVSNSDTPLVADLYGDPPWHMLRVPVSRAINSRADRRGAVLECLACSDVTMATAAERGLERRKASTGTSRKRRTSRLTALG